MSTSSNSCDTAVFRLNPDDTGRWLKYDLDGTHRAEFPLDPSTSDETYAAGVAVDRTSREPVVISEWPPSGLNKGRALLTVCVSVNGISYVKFCDELRVYRQHPSLV